MENLNELPEDERKSRLMDMLSDSSDIVALTVGLSVGELPETGTTITGTFPGDEKAEALGRAYHLRDRIEENGGEASVEYIEPVVYVEDTTFHEVRIAVLSGADGDGDEGDSATEGE